MILSVCPNPSVDTYWWMDALEKGVPNRVSRQEPYPGGKGVHVALNVAALQRASALLGIWAGSKGKWLQQACKEKQVVCSGIWVEGENRSCITVMSDDASVADTEFLETGPAINTAAYHSFLELYNDLLADADQVVLSGSWPPGAPKDAYGAFIDAANEKGIPVWIDCAGDLLRQAILHAPFGIHINKKEAIDLRGDLTAAKDYLLQYCRQVALTMGKEGLLFCTREKELYAHCRVDNVISTVGCGDALLAGIAVASAEHYPLKEIAAYGTACGGANCMRHELGMFYKKDVALLLQQVSINENR